MSNKVNNIHKYKRAIKITKDLNEALLIFKKFIIDIEPFLKYTTVMETHRTASDNLMWMKLHLEDQEKIAKSKGEE